MFMAHAFLFKTGTDERRIIQILTSHNNDQRQEIAAKYKTMYGRVSHIQILVCN